MNTFKIPINISKRHIHLKKEDVEILFGKNYELTVRNNLLQPGQFAANESVIVSGPKGTFDKVRIVGPVRSYTQLEVSKTDSVFLGIFAPLSYAGKLEGATTVSIVGPVGKIECACAIIALRHIHLSVKEADLLGLKDDQCISIKINGIRGVVFENVIVRVSLNSKAEFHIDTDEGNAIDFSVNTVAEII